MIGVRLWRRTRGLEALQAVLLLGVAFLILFGIRQIWTSTIKPAFQQNVRELLSPTATAPGSQVAQGPNVEPPQQRPAPDVRPPLAKPLPPVAKPTPTVPPVAKPTPTNPKPTVPTAKPTPTVPPVPKPTPTPTNTPPGGKPKPKPEELDNPLEDASAVADVTSELTQLEAARRLTRAQLNVLLSKDPNQTTALQEEFNKILDQLDDVEKIKKFANILGKLSLGAGLVVNTARLAEAYQRGGQAALTAELKKIGVEMAVGAVSTGAFAALGSLAGPAGTIAGGFVGGVIGGLIAEPISSWWLGDDTNQAPPDLTFRPLG